MADPSRWLRQLKGTLTKASKHVNIKGVQRKLTDISRSANAKQLQSGFELMSKHVQRSANHHYQNLPQYTEKVRRTASKANQQAQANFQDFASSRPYIKQTLNKCQAHVETVSSKLAKVNVKQNIDATIKHTKKLADSAQSTSKKLLDTTSKTASKVVATPSKIRSSTRKVTEPVKSSVKSVQRMLSPSEWSKVLYKLRQGVLIYGIVGIVSLMFVNQTSYMGLLYVIRRRHDETRPVGKLTDWTYKWLNIPTREEEAISPVRMESYAVMTDMRLSKMAYNGLLVTRLGAAVVMTVVAGTPIFRVALWLGRYP